MRAAVEKYVNQKWDDLNSAVDVEYAMQNCYNELIASLRIDLGILYDVNSEFEVYQHYNEPPNLLEVLYHNYLIGKDVELLIRDKGFYGEKFFDNPDFFIWPEKEKTPNNNELLIINNEDVQSQDPIFRLLEKDFSDISAIFFDYACKKQLLRKISFRNTDRVINSDNSDTQIDPSSQITQHQLEPRNVFNNVPIEKVRAFFGNLCDDDKLVLTECELDLFISRAFQGASTIEKQTLNTAFVNKTSIVKLFHLFYIACTNNQKFEPRKNCIEKYRRLLSDNFTNWEQAGKVTNFSRNRMHQWGETKTIG
jgi:hypothetical protein